MKYFCSRVKSAVADLRGGTPGAPRPKIFSISCNFLENFAKSYVGLPSCRVGAPSYGNPGSAPEVLSFISLLNQFY